jgi:hypothetical protein
MADDTAAARDAWRDLVDTLSALGARITGAPEQGYSAGESLEHLVRQLVCWSTWEALHADPGRPFFQRQLDLQTQWGGPNNDNVYRHARVSPDHRYRIRGRMHSCEDFILALRAGFFHNEVWGTKVEITASDLGIREGDDFEILLGGAEPGAIAIPDGVIMATVREYYLDWRAEEPAVFTVECLDPPPPADLEAAEAVRRVQAARSHVLDSMEYWHDYMAKNRADQGDNAFPATLKLAKGLSAARYENCYWALEPDEALIVEAEEPDARYWSAQLYQMDTFDLVDRFGRITSRNHRQTRVSDDGIVRWVLAPEDPGVANWLDTAGRRVGLCILRWFWPRSERGFSPRTRVVETSEVRTHLPADEPTVTIQQRAEELSRRQAHLRWRFRS